MLKRSAQIVLLMGVIGALVVLAVPLVMSSDTVKTRIEAQLSDVIGRPVRLSGDSSLSLFPYLGVSYSNVSIGQPQDKGQPLVQIDELRAQLGTFSVLWGEARLSKVTLVRPRLSLTRDSDGRPNWLPVSGRLQRLLDSKDISNAGTFPLGVLTVQDGIISYPNSSASNEGVGGADALSELTAVNGTLTWSDLASDAKLAFDAVWRGENVTVSAQAETPFNLLTGQRSNMTLSINANPMKLTYDGAADGDAFSVLEGALSVETPSLRRLASWLNRTEDIAAKLGKVSLSGQLLKQNKDVSLTGATVLIDEDTGTGQLQLVDEPGRNLEISGTLAFGELTLPAWSHFFRSDIATASDGTTQQLDFSFLRTIDLDLRISAQNAQSNGLSIQNLAATLLVREGTASLDIGSADALGGVFSGVFGVEPGEPNQFVFETNFKKVELPALTALLGQNNLALRGVGDARLRFKSQASVPGEFLRKLSGEGTLSSRDGALEGVDLQVARAVGEGATAQTTIFSGNTPFNTLQIGFFVSDGIVYLRNSSLENQELTATLNGKADLVRRSIALRGNVRPNQETAEGVDVPSYPFFVGGIAEAPLYAPLPQRIATPPPAKPEETGTPPSQ